MAGSWVRSWWLGMRHVLAPGLCWGCNRLLAPECDAFCTDCASWLTHDPHMACPRCAGTVGPHVDLSDGCVHCRGEAFAFERVVRLGPYAGLLRSLILRMKQSDGDTLAAAVGDVFAAERHGELASLAADVVVPVPLHFWRRLGRGFNQSGIVAEMLARKLHLPCRPRWLRRVRATPRQTSLSATDRRANVRGAFRANRAADLTGRSVLLVDDVLTTGSTAHAAAQALKAAGARRVVVAVIGHG